MAKQERRKVQQQKKNTQLLLWGAVALIAVAAIVWMIAGGNSTSSSGLPAEISVSEALAKKEAGVFILDVRQPDEWNEAHIQDATLIPLDQLPNRINELPKDQEIVVVCRSGNRSAQGRDILLQAGFTQVTSMAGGLNQWKAAGYPTVSGP
ncbi:MAG: rhodanese-like domain-containing protein [Anaerolineales bacterium]